MDVKVIQFLLYVQTYSEGSVDEISQIANYIEIQEGKSDLSVIILY